ncbi:MtrAB system histidine kinase MtrB [Streptomyces sp. CNQ085]|uniref:MtrAB system histidine kinase MtrB n=1 Tax=Streptomyces sp. CNQ085 TaxID=2886944 RepID=UPI001F50B435|nr:MtrAB system histidine kinase MtrB [Streptomyces sp. CNQ085]MCI0384992.1 HAMP domain-containing histidine kinase [Streptomyces sp. CNQ085]
MWRGGRFLSDGLLSEGATGSRAHPLFRMFVRWVRRPLLAVVRLWRRNIQLRVVTATLLMSLAVVLLLGLVVIGQVSNGLLDAKQQAARSQAAGGFAVAEQLADDVVPGGTGNGRDVRQDTGTWLNDLVTQLASGGQGVYYLVALSSEEGPGTFGAGEGSDTHGPRASFDLKPEESVSPQLREALDDSPDTYEQYGTIVLEGGRTEAALVIGKRLSDPNGDPYQLYYLFPFQQEEKSLSLVKGTLATAGVFVVVLLGAIAWLVVRQVVTPVRMAARISERLAAGRLQERMKVSGEDDIARLGESFNKMAKNLQTKIQQLEELSRMQRRFVSDVSHELRTPLTTVRMAADVIHEARDEFDPVTARSAELLLGQLDRFESLLADLLEISRFDAKAAALEADPVDLRDVVRRVLEGAEPLAERKGSRLLVYGDERPVVAEADARRVERVLRNLVVNAVEHGEGRDIVVRLASGGGAVAVAVRDYGVGLKPGEANRVFNRFWRADPARARTTGGTGLGLSIAVEDARLHGGWLQAWGEPGGGSQFRLTVPQTAGEQLRGSPIPLEPADSRRRREEAQAPPGEARASAQSPAASRGTAREPHRSRGGAVAPPREAVDGGNEPGGGEPDTRRRTAREPEEPMEEQGGHGDHGERQGD